MATKLHVAFLWHMHQPYYVDTRRGEALMPWVRLHATKGYLDMIWMVERFPGFRCTFNLTPVLLKQIEELARGDVRDCWHELAATPAESLTPEQKASLLEHFFKANWENMIKPHPRYWMLLQKRGLRPAPSDLPRLARSFSAQEYRDLQVWYNLAWFGYAAGRLYPEIAELKRKGHQFTETDKKVLFEQQQDILQNIVACYKARAEAGQIEISTTPFYHPIMPLLYNTGFAQRCMPGAELPDPAYVHPEDVRAQLKLACDYHAQLFGAPPTGIWPSEGSVCPEIVPILQELGLKWFATDEEILWRSLGEGNHDRGKLFKGYRAQYRDSSACIAFRERALSDFVGFTAARNEPKKAADFIVQHLKEIARSTHEADALCPVILDGENAWESFSDGGEAFLSELYRQLGEQDEIETTTFKDYFTQYPARHELGNLHTGSWIGSNFRIWIGHPEDVSAWEILGRTRAFLDGKIQRGEVNDEQQQMAMREIYAAEGSDWFWWYGDDFVTDNDLIFDELFRAHLQNVYRILGETVPDFLKARICRSEVKSECLAPRRLIAPVIDGRVTSYYEWLMAGFYDPSGEMGAMYQAERVLKAIYFGADLQNFYLRVDFAKTAYLPASMKLKVTFVETAECVLSVSNLQSNVLPVLDFKQPNDRGKATDGLSQIQIAFDSILEIAIPYSALSDVSLERLAFSIEMLDRDVQFETHPSMGVFRLDLPNEESKASNWWV
jgi:alpha-amylase/alpha-mannosidase (GH57 family)